MSYGYPSSLPEIVVVSDKVMKLNVELRKLSVRKKIMNSNGNYRQGNSTMRLVEFFP